MYSVLYPAEQSTAGNAFALQRQGNRWVCLRKVQGVRQVERLISTDPYDYLEPYWLPGKAFDNRPRQGDALPNRYSNYFEQKGMILWQTTVNPLHPPQRARVAPKR